MSVARWGAWAALVACAVLGCAKEKTGTVAGPGLTGVPATSAPPSAPSAAASAPNAAPRELPTLVTAPGAPVRAAFVTLVPAGTRIPLHACEETVVAAVRGDARVDSDTVPEGAFDVLPLSASPAPEALVFGAGSLAVVAQIDAPGCDADGGTAPAPGVRAAGAPLVFAGGAMRAAFGVTDGPAYVGRLEGTAPVAEHAHDGSWEVLCAVDAAGTFTLAGKEQRLGPQQIVVVPPKTKHAWKPDAGSPLVGVQIYDPPGPEQRFKKLAADAADAGAR